VIASEQTNPNDNPIAVAARQQFHDGIAARRNAGAIAPFAETLRKLKPLCDPKL
jgi:hypothetical protein